MVGRLQDCYRAGHVRFARFEDREFLALELRCQKAIAEERSGRVANAWLTLFLI